MCLRLCLQSLPRPSSIILVLLIAYPTIDAVLITSLNKVVPMSAVKLLKNWLAYPYLHLITVFYPAFFTVLQCIPTFMEYALGASKANQAHMTVGHFTLFSILETFGVVFHFWSALKHSMKLEHKVWKFIVDFDFANLSVAPLRANVPPASHFVISYDFSIFCFGNNV